MKGSEEDRLDSPSLTEVNSDELETEGRLPSSVVLLEVDAVVVNVSGWRKREVRIMLSEELSEKTESDSPSSVELELELLEDELTLVLEAEVEVEVAVVVALGPPLAELPG